MAQWSKTDGVRWPNRLYAEGTDPDPRFTLANERTFLAWIRTSLALMASGVGVAAFGASDAPLWTALAIVLLGLGIVCGGTSFVRWAAAERALRLQGQLPPPRLAPVLQLVLLVVGVAVCALLFGGGG